MDTYRSLIVLDCQWASDRVAMKFSSGGRHIVAAGWGKNNDFSYKVWAIDHIKSQDPSTSVNKPTSQDPATDIRVHGHSEVDSGTGNPTVLGATKH